jgi:hypothetical protein
MQRLKRTPFLLALSTLALASALLLSCTGLERAVSYDRYKIDPKIGAAIERFMKQILAHRPSSIDEFLNYTGVREYYVLEYTSQPSDQVSEDQDWFLAPIYAPGYSYQQMKSPENVFYAVTEQSFQLPFEQPEIGYFFLATRGGKLYAIGNAGNDLRDFRKTFRKVQTVYSGSNHTTGAPPVRPSPEAIAR